MLPTLNDYQIANGVAMKGFLQIERCNNDLKFFFVLLMLFIGAFAAFAGDSAFDDETIGRDESIKKGPWEPDEDKKLRALHEVFGSKRWKQYEPHLPGRNAKQIRGRFVNHLDPELKKGRFTPSQRNELCRLQREYYKKFGRNRWALIAKHFPGKTDNDIKNVWRSETTKKFAMELAKLDVEKKTDFSNGQRSSPNKKRKLIPVKIEPDISSEHQKLRAAYRELEQSHQNLWGKYQELLTTYSAQSEVSTKATCPECTHEFYPNDFKKLEALTSLAADREPIQNFCTNVVEKYPAFH